MKKLEVFSHQVEKIFIFREKWKKYGEEINQDYRRQREKADMFQSLRNDEIYRVCKQMCTRLISIRYRVYQGIGSLLSFKCHFFCYIKYRWRLRACGPFVIKWQHLI